jgi:hypothetical protein
VLEGFSGLGSRHSALSAYGLSDVVSHGKADIFMFFFSAQRSITCLLVTTDKEERSMIAWSGHETVLLKGQHQAMREVKMLVIIIQ